jgi:hypothetical protein
VGAVEVARAEMRVIEQKLDETKIRSPINGTVLEVLAHPGEALTAGPNSAGILRIADLSALIAEVDVSETDLKAVHVGQEAEVSSDAQPGHEYRGIVREIAEQADRARGTVLVKVDILPDAPETDDSGSGKAPPDAGSAAGSAATVVSPTPEPKQPPAKKGRKRPPPKKDKKKAPTPPPSPSPSASPSPSPEPVAKPIPVTTLRPGMAVQVRFIAKAQAP